MTDIYLTLPKKSSSRDSLKVVMMSDLHIGEMIGKKNVQRFVKMSNAQHPDLVVIAGDIIDYESRFAENAHIEDDLRQLKAPLGVYGIYGNHEYRANRFAKFRWFAKTGITFLVDSVVSPDSTFTLIGRDDFVNHESYTDFYRDLNIDKALASTHYKANGVTYTREVFTSFVDNVVIMH